MMTRDEALALAEEELQDIQFEDNDWRQARVERAKARAALLRLANRLCPHGWHRVDHEEAICATHDAH